MNPHAGVGTQPERAPGRLRRLTSGLHPGSSGPVVASVFQRCFALILIAAWASLGWQIRLLIGETGLLPLRPLLQDLAASGRPRLPGAWGIDWLEFPTLFRWPALAGDAVLVAGTLVGIALGAAAFLRIPRVSPRVCFALSVVLYLSYATVCGSFLAFQWDNLLLECGLLAAFLPRHRPAPLVHLLFRVVVFKLYFQSGLAKWQSPIGDWVDGSAMGFYYETAPLPTWLGYFAHQLPAGWHRFESWAVLAGELLVPLAIFAGRRPRLVAAAILSLFQVTNLLTANYGFFCFLALALHLFLLDDADLTRALAALRVRPAPPLPAVAVRPGAFPLGVAILGTALHLGISVLEGLERFAPGAWQAQVLPLARLYSPLRLVNSYHLFASVTRERIEPELESRQQGRWVALDLKYKPGPAERRPPFVAPHQPRVDFLLWFHGLAWQRTPAYLATLLGRLCYQPDRVQPLFAGPLPERAEAVRVMYYQYHFTAIDNWRRTGAYWRRVFVATGPELSCDR